jgi:hypothetical protein
MALSRRQCFFPLRQEPSAFSGPADHGFIYDQYCRYINVVKSKLLLSILLIFLSLASYAGAPAVGVWVRFVPEDMAQVVNGLISLGFGALPLGSFRNFGRTAVAFSWLD